MKAIIPGCARVMSGSCVFFLILVSQFSGHEAFSAPIINAKTQMITSGEQTLSLMNFQTGRDYFWSIEEGEGSLSADQGEEVVYLAPDVNPGCTYNPSIRVTDQDGNYTEIEIAVNGFSGTAMAYKYGRECSCGVWDGSRYNWGCGARAYSCDGTYLGLTAPSASCWSSNSRGCGVCPDWCGICGEEDNLVDLRREEMIAAGCCSETMLASLAPKHPVPEDIDFGKDPAANVPICDPSLRGNPIRVYNGNNIESEEDIWLNSPFRGKFGLKRFYNSKSQKIGPFGYGWIHSYCAHLEPNYEYDGDVYLKITDETGRGVYFRAQTDGEYLGAFKEKTSVKVEQGNHVWLRLDGSRYVFDDLGFLVQIKDSIGNRQILSYDTENRLHTVTDEATGRVLSFEYNEEGFVDHISGPSCDGVPDGVWVTYGYDTNQNLVSVNYADETGFDYTYADAKDIHNLTEKRNRMGHRLSTWAYDDQDRATESVTRDGLGVVVEYVNDNEVVVTDVYGVARRYSIWDTIAGRKRVTDIEGPPECPSCGNEVVRLEYDEELRVIEVEYAGGLINQYQDFDNLGRAQTVIIAVGTTEEKTIFYAFHPHTQERISQTEASVAGPGNKTSIWDFDSDGDNEPNEDPTPVLHRKIERGFTRDKSGNIVPYEYITIYAHNSRGQVVSIDGPQPGPEDRTTFTYHSSTGDLLTNTKPIIGTTTFSGYDAAGQVGRLTDPNGNPFSFTFDGRGRIKTVTNETDGGITAYEYNEAGELSRVTSANGVAFDYSYDPVYGRLNRITDPLGNYTQFLYDAQGNRTDIGLYDPSDLKLYWVRHDYHGSTYPGRLWKEINPDGTFTEYSYDASGNIVSVRDAKGKITRYEYDILGRLIRVTQPGGVITTYTYNSRSNLVSITDAENHTTIYGYDDLGRRIQAVSPDTGTTAYTYDASGNLTQKRDAKVNATTYTYDALSRLTGVHFPDSVQDIILGYDEGSDGKGRLTSMRDPSGRYLYRYDSAGNLLREEKAIENVTYITEYSYDLAGVFTGMTYPDGRTVSYDLDPLGRITGVTSTKASFTTTLAEGVHYLPFGPPYEALLGNGVGINREFDRLYRFIGLETGGVQRLEYALDPVGTITSITNLLDFTKSQVFGYDDLYRLTSATGSYGTLGFSYDKVGNRLSKIHNGMVDNYVYETGSNRLSQITGEDPRGFSYDANGNTTAVGGMSLVYNQNNRLVRVVEGSETLAEYVYNGNGQRVKKATDNCTAIFHYDQFGNLIGESDKDGQFLVNYVYLENNRLAAITEPTAQEISVRVFTSRGRSLSGVRVYAFTGAGSYTGISAVSDEDGVAQYALSEFSEGTYTFRADHLTCPFWSPVVALPETTEAEILIEEETAEVLVTVAREVKEGVKVYLFNENGTYLGLYRTTDVEGKAFFDLPVRHGFKFRADYLSHQYWSSTTVIGSGGPTSVSVHMEGGNFAVTVERAIGEPVADIKTYLFSATGTYLGLCETTDGNGQATLQASAGDYKVRADYLGYHFWTDPVGVHSDAAYTLTIPHRDVTVSVEGDYDGDVVSIENITVYLFTPLGSYLHLSQVTNGQGTATFSLPEKDYKVRADYLGKQYWSDVFSWQDLAITINEGVARVTVTEMGQPLQGVHIYMFNSAGTYLNIGGLTDDQGLVSFRIPEGEYNFRADYMGSQYWSGNMAVIAHVLNPIKISTGGGSFNLMLQKGPAAPLEGVSCYLFDESGVYLGTHGVTSSAGELSFNLPDGTYKIRIDYLGYQYWTDIFNVPDTLSFAYTIAHQDVTITIEGVYSGDVAAKKGVPVHLFMPGGTYLNLSLQTDAQGKVSFNLPEKDFKVRADYLAARYWSEVFRGEDSKITIHEGLGKVHVVQGSQPLGGVNVYVFSTLDAYLGINGDTDENGVVSFRLPEGTYKYRADSQGSQYWGTAPLEAHEVNQVYLDTGGGLFTLIVEKDDGVPMVDVPVYVFNSAGSYVRISGRTDGQGQASFDLSEGGYKFRVDYLGYKFWSETYNLHETLTGTLVIPHQEVMVTVNKYYGGHLTLLEGVKAFLFTSSGSYVGISGTTNADGEVTFNLPQQDFKVRVDYFGGKYWSEIPKWFDVHVDILHGAVDAHVTFGGFDLFDAPVYLFTESGSYLGRYQRTNELGHVEFIVPAGSYKLRADHNGAKYWSDVVNVTTDETINVELVLEQLAFNSTNKPTSSRYAGKAATKENEPIQVATIGSLAGILAQAAVGDHQTERVYYYVNDHLGTPQAMLDENGEVVWSADYKLFGEATVDPRSTLTNNFRFPGQYYDAEIGVHQNYLRYYFPKTGTYATPDPLGITGGINPFIYAGSDPVNTLDPWGLFILKHHKEILFESLGGTLTKADFAVVLQGNMSVDWWQLRDMHFDNNRFDENLRKIEKLRGRIESECNRQMKLYLFGQLTHAVHDFYAHSNYVEKFLETNPDAEPEDIVPLLSLNAEGLRSGSFSIVKWIMGRDTHSVINKDAPNTLSSRKLSSTGHSYFEYAKAAAIKHTEILYFRFQN